MANKKDKEENVRATATLESKTKRVHNRGNGKIELLINGSVVVVPPRGTIRVPKDFEVPNGIGLYVK